MNAKQWHDKLFRAPAVEYLCVGTFTCKSTKGHDEDCESQLPGPVFVEELSA